MGRTILALAKAPLKLLRGVFDTFIVIVQIIDEGAKKLPEPTRYRFRLFQGIHGVDRIDDSEEFEKYVAALFELAGDDVQHVGGSRDFGVDVVAEKDGIKYAIQCKHYTSTVGVSAVREALAGREYYGCDVALVVTNNRFTQPAKELASKTQCELVDRDQLDRMILENIEILKEKLKRLIQTAMKSIG